LSSHLKESIFPNPHELIPERWLQRDAETTLWSERTGESASEMLAAWYPFSKATISQYTCNQLTDASFAGQGARACAGRSVAEIEILLVVSALVKTFRFSLHESTTEASMRCVAVAISVVLLESVLTGFFNARGVDTGVLAPKAGKCLIKFDLDLLVPLGL